MWQSNVTRPTDVAATNPLAPPVMPIPPPPPSSSASGPPLPPPPVAPPTGAVAYHGQHVMVPPTTGTAAMVSYGNGSWSSNTAAAYPYAYGAYTGATQNAPMYSTVGMSQGDEDYDSEEEVKMRKNAVEM